MVILLEVFGLSQDELTAPHMDSSGEERPGSASTSPITDRALIHPPTGRNPTATGRRPPADAVALAGSRWPAPAVTLAIRGLHLNTRFADMVKVFSPGSGRACLAGLPGTGCDLAAGTGAVRLSRPKTNAAPPPQEQGRVAETAKAKVSDAARRGRADDHRPRRRRATTSLPPSPLPTLRRLRRFPRSRSSRTRTPKSSSTSRTSPDPQPRTMPAMSKRSRRWPSNPNPVDPTVIRRMVDGMVAQLTDTKNIQALIDPPPVCPQLTHGRAIEEATATCSSRSIVAGNQEHAVSGRIQPRSAPRLAPLLKHHLVPRVQAMIVLGQSGNPEALKLFLDEIKNPQQTVWVKLWAMRGSRTSSRIPPLACPPPRRSRRPG